MAEPQVAVNSESDPYLPQPTVQCGQVVVTYRRDGSVSRGYQIAERWLDEPEIPTITKQE